MTTTNEKLRNVAEIAAKIMMGEKALHPNQQKLDVHEPEKDELTAKDFEKLRAGKKAEVKKEDVEVDEAYTNSIHDVGGFKSTLNAKPDSKSIKPDSKRPDSKSLVTHSTSLVRSTSSPGETVLKLTSSPRKLPEDVDAAAATILEYESKDGKFVHRARPGAYGGTKDEKHAVDTLAGPKTKELKAIESEKKKKKFSEDLDLYKEGGIKGLFEAWAKKKAMKEEQEQISEEPTSAEFDAQLADAKQRAAGTKKQPEVSKPAVQAVQNEQTHTTVEFIDYNDVNGVKISEIDLTEKKMTPAETKKKEKIVKSMKKGISGFKARYGKNAKSVMYATAAKRAMGEEVEQIEEASDAHQAGYNYTHETIEDAQSKAEVHRHHRAIQADNPHPKGSQEHKDWTAGTDKAKDDHLKDWS